MWKKVAGLAVVILALVVLITGMVASVNAANDNNGASVPQFQGRGPGGPGNIQDDTLMEKVAAILGIQTSTLQDAFKQAHQSIAQERQDEMFSKLVADGKLTQAQADQYKAWLAARPEGMPGMGICADTTKATEMLDKLLAGGKITQTQYDAFKAWIAAKPAVELSQPEKPANADANNQGLKKGPGAGGLSTEMLDKLLSDGKITQETYDAYKSWLDARPTVDLPKPKMPPAGKCPSNN